MTAILELKDIVQKGLVADIFKMERAYHLLMQIGQNSELLNQKNIGNFGELFGSLQSALQTEAVLAVARVYDIPNDRYPTRCLRRALDLLEKNAPVMPEVVEIYNTKLALAFMGSNSTVVNAVDSGTEGFLSKFVPTYRSILDSHDVSELVELLKNLRDKRIAHNEAAEPNGPTWESLRQLIEYAQNFVGVMGWAFFSTAYVHDGAYFLSEDAKRPSRAFARLVERLQVGI